MQGHHTASTSERSTAHDYQAYAIDYIEAHPVAAVLLDMGLGKTVISLTAIADLLFDSFEAHRVLVVAPLRVARDTWPAEIEKWAHLQDLTYTVAVGSARERKAALMVSADITIINRENLSWLIESSGFPFGYDTVVIDELSSFKNHQSKRFKALLRVRPKVKRIIGLTGTPSSNGLMDLWAEFRLLDMGHRLGRFITQYRNTFFLPDKRNGKPILVAYWFRHDVQRIKKRFDVRELKSSKDIADWNSGKIPVAVIHPASAGHGLNLQAGGSTLIWFGLTWSLELYQQTNARLWRQGQSSGTVVIQHIITKGTIDERILKALEAKDRTQAALIDAVKVALEV